jgi:RHS repeat-associated protein
VGFVFDASWLGRRFVTARACAMLFGRRTMTFFGLNGRVAALLLAATAVFTGAAQAQDATLPSVTVGRASAVTPTNAQTYYNGLGLTSSVRSTNPDTEITELARALKYDPDIIYDWVRNNAEIELTFGLSKGARGVAIDKSGNAFDQAHLMVELLRASSITAKYAFGTITLTGTQFTDWTGISDATAAAQILSNGGIPHTISASGATITSVTMMHMWVKATIGGTEYQFDPSYKPYTFKTGINLNTAMGFNGSTFVSNALSGSSSDTTLGFPRLRNLNEGNIASDLATYSQTLLTYLKTSMPTARMEDVIGGQRINHYTGVPIRQTSLPYTSSINSTFTNDVPNSLRTTLRIRGGGTLDVTYYADVIYGKLLTVEKASGSTVSVKHDGTAVTTVSSGTFFTESPAPKLTFDIGRPYAASSGAYMDRQVIQTGFINNGPIVVFLGLGDVSPDYSARLANFIGGGTTTSKASRETCWYVAGTPTCSSAATLNVTQNDASGIRAAAGWLAQFSRMAKVYARMSGSIAQHHQTIGVSSAIWSTYNNGDLIKTSLKLNLETGISLEHKTNDAAKRQATLSAVTSAANTLEGAIVSQVVSTSSPVSVAAKLDWVNRESLPTDTDWVYYADSTNWTTVKAQLLADYNGTKLAETQAEALVNAGYAVVIPRSSDLGPGLDKIITNMGPPVVTAPGPERGSALIATRTDDSSFAYFAVRNASTEKGGGGEVGLVPKTLASPEDSALSDFEQTRGRDYSVDVQSGDLVYQASPDMTVGNGGYPYSLSFQRSFSPGGWTHNYASAASIAGNGVLASGLISPREAVELIAAFNTQLYLAPTSQAAAIDKLKRHVAAAMVDQWWAERVKTNQLVLTAGDGGAAFTKLADGTWYSTAGDATQLTVNSPAAPGSGTCSATPKYIVTFKDQSKANFAECLTTGGVAATLITSRTYPFGMSVTYTYDAGTMALTQVTNSLGRTIKIATSGANTTITDDSDAGNIRTTTLLGGSFCNTGACSSLFTGATNPLGQTTSYTYVTPTAPYQQSTFLKDIRLPSAPSTAFVTFGYDALNRVKTVTDVAGKVWNYLIANGRRGGVTDPTSATAFTVYDDEGNAVRAIDAIGRVTTYEFDALRRVTKAILPEGNRTEYQYDGNHNATTVTEVAKPGSGLTSKVTTATYHGAFNVPLTITDPLGRVTTMTYGATTGQLLTVTQPTVGGQNPITTYTYDGFGQLTTHTDPTGLVMQYTYHATNGNLLSTISDPGAGHVASTTALAYDANGNVTSVTDPNGNITSATYDKLRRLTQVTSPLGAQFKRTYNADGLLTKTEAATGNALTPWATTTLSYYNTQRVQTSTDPDGRVSSFEYDDSGRRTVAIDPDGRRTKFVYDAAGQVLQQISAETTALQQTHLQMTYSANGLVLTKKDARNNTTAGVYDGFDRLSQTTYPDATYEGFGYDARDNRLSTLTRGGQLITTSYDALDRVATRVVPQPGAAPAVQTTYTYDLANRATQISDTNGHVIGYSFDTARRVTAISQAGPGIPSARSVSYQYDPAGNRTRLTWPDGYYVQYAYDALHRLTTATENGTFVLASYTYDPLSRHTGAAHGNSTSVSRAYSTGADLLNLVNNFVGSSVTHGHTYTAAHRLKDETVSTAVWRFAPAAVETTTYGAANNLNQYPHLTKGANPTVTLAYDASGNLSGDGTWTFAYDAENKMTSATKTGTTATYAYDPLLRREGKTVNGVTTTFLLDRAEEIGEYDGTGAMLRRYVPSNATDAPIAVVEGTGGGIVRKWFHRNRLGSTIAISDGAGSVSEGPITYDPFGNSSSTGGVPFKFTGRRYDTETGLYYYRARYYSPSLGRFMQTDPIGTCDNINLYAYVSNDPLNKTDPTGLAEVPKYTVYGKRPKERSTHPQPFAFLNAPNMEAGGDDKYAEPGECDSGCPGKVEHVLVTADRLPKTDQKKKGGGPPPGVAPPRDRSFGGCLDWCVTTDPYTSGVVKRFGERLFGTGGPATYGEVGIMWLLIIRSQGASLVIYAGFVDATIAICTGDCMLGISGNGPS